MPGEMDGLGLLNFVCKAYAGVPVIMTSWHLAEPPQAATRPAHFLPKPYLIEQLTGLIEAALAEVS
jgi:DNA-binding NtrC family response regulator